MSCLLEENYCDDLRAQIDGWTHAKVGGIEVVDEAGEGDT